ncbi:ribokinase [Jatrophihabitans endophyticus]|uniref:ribokinase n=1 Tax=Jatrophihabitans endophyticus TaxID=1206085 RepID=UPI0019DE5822|nr:ribokinase [Jatrophihabitans endophyticus]MBE7189646.1 ribokinase [Jatrophihabitans endophyticus]
MADVVVVGSANRDVSVETEAFPGPGETVLGTAVRTSMGGKGANQAAAAALAGADTAMLARIGDDDAGREVLAALGRVGVDTALVQAVAGTPTGTAAITVAGGENSIVVVPGANHAWPDAWPDGTDRRALLTAGVVLAQLEIPVAVANAAADLTERFVLNASPATPLPDELLARCSVLVVNEHELAALGEPADLLRRGVGAVVTTLGGEGAVVTDASGIATVPSPPAEVVDTTGAGDAFAGVLCAKLAAGLPLREAVRWAVAAGSWAVRSAGTVGSYADAERLAALVG